MKRIRTLSTVLGLFATMAFADIVVKPDGTVSCTGRCDGVITGGTYTVCQGGTCVTISTGGGSGGPSGSAHK